jgi:hypothetical protein
MALLKFKRSAVPGKAPTLADLELGEFAINTFDGKVFMRRDNGTASIIEVGGGGGVQTIASADGSVAITGTTNIDLSVAVAGSTSNVTLPVRNSTGSTLTKGTAVYINGSTGQNSTVARAIANSDATSAQTLGLVTADISNNSVGQVTLIGTITNINTSAYSDGQQLYLSPTTAGGLTATKPFAPQHIVYVAVVERAHPTQGKLFVKVQNGYEMDELHDVSAQNPANNDGLFYSTTSGLWEKKSIATALGYTPVNRAGDTLSGALTINSGSNQIILGSDGAIELTRSGGGAYIDFKDSTAKDFDVRMQVSGTALSIASPGGVNLNGLVSVSGSGAVPAIRLVNTVAGRDYRVWQKDDGRLTITDETAAAERLTINSAGVVTVSVDIRAPIFYDSNNTAFYIDPASTSVINTVNLSRINMASSNSVYAGSDGSGWMFGGTGYVYLNQGGLTYAQTRIMARDGIGQDTAALLILHGGTSAGTQINTAARSPIYYDLDNTGYYLDPTGGTSLRTVGDWRSDSAAWTGEFNGKIQYHASNWYFQAAGGWEFRRSDTVNAFSVNQTGFGTFRSNLRVGSSENASTIHMGDADEGERLIHCNSNRIGFLTQAGGWGVWCEDNGSWRTDVDMWAPVFYDINDSAFYLNPASDIRVRALKVTGETEYPGSINGDWEGGYYHFSPGQDTPGGVWGHAHIIRLSNLWNVQTFWPTTNTNEIWNRRRNNGTYSAWRRSLLEDEWIGNKYFGSDGAIYGTIFYDANNSARYIDPTGSSFVQGNFYVVRDGNSNDAFGGLEMRENSFQGAGTGAATEAPGINFHWSARAAARLYMNSGGSFVLGGQGDITNNRRSLFINELFASGNVTAYFSDERLKTRQGNIQNALQIVSKLNGFRYTNNDLAKSFGYEGDQVQLGVSAQEVEAVLPEIVRQAAFDIDSDDPNHGSKSGENYKTVQYDRLVPLLIEAIKELTNEIETLKADIRSK